MVLSARLTQIGPVGPPTLRVLTDECRGMLTGRRPKSCLSPGLLPCLPWCLGDRDRQAFT